MLLTRIIITTYELDESLRCSVEIRVRFRHCCAGCHSGLAGSIGAVARFSWRHEIRPGVFINNSGLAPRLKDKLGLQFLQAQLKSGGVLMCIEQPPDSRMERS
jgi:hypothetical protein